MINGQSYDDYIGTDRLDVCACGETVRTGEEYCPDCADLLTVADVEVEPGDSGD